MSVVSKAIVEEVNVYGESVREFFLSIDNLEHYEPGQFLQLSLQMVSASDIWPESRTFSIASYSMQAKRIRLIIKKQGDYTSRIFDELQSGSTCTVKYAYGDFLLPMFDEEESIHCIAGGTGIAPFLSFIDFLAVENNTKRIFVYYSARTVHELVCREVLNKTLPKENLKVYCTRENSNDIINRRIELNDIMDNVKNLKDEHFYICGSNEFIQKFKGELEDIGAQNIYTDEWS